MQEEEAKLRTIEQEVKVAEANVATIQTRIDDATLKSPVHGRVLYRLAEVGEVLGAGGKALTLVNLNDVYMEIFLPSEQATRLKIGAEGRLTVDYAPGRAIAGYVSFVSPEAQFTPKQVETRSEREKLMFRVKIRVPEKTVESYIELIKTGVRGVGYVKVDELRRVAGLAAEPFGPQRKRRKGEPRAGEASRISNERRRSEGRPVQSEGYSDRRPLRSRQAAQGNARRWSKGAHEAPQILTPSSYTPES